MCLSFRSHNFSSAKDIVGSGEETILDRVEARAPISRSFGPSVCSSVCLSQLAPSISYLFEMLYQSGMIIFKGLTTRQTGILIKATSFAIIVNQFTINFTFSNYFETFLIMFNNFDPFDMLPNQIIAIFF